VTVITIVSLLIRITALQQKHGKQTLTSKAPLRLRNVRQRSSEDLHTSYKGTNFDDRN
jgi:hypothetical protein